MGGCCATREKEVKLVEKKDSKEDPNEKPEQIDSEISYKSDFEEGSEEDEKFAAPLEDDT